MKFVIETVLKFDPDVFNIERHSDGVFSIEINTLNELMALQKDVGFPVIINYEHPYSINGINIDVDRFDGKLTIYDSWLD